MSLINSDTGTIICSPSASADRKTGIMPLNKVYGPTFNTGLTSMYLAQASTRTFLAGGILLKDGRISEIGTHGGNCHRRFLIAWNING